VLNKYKNLINFETHLGLIAVEQVQQRMRNQDDGKTPLQYDAILMDFVMPLMDGPTATKKIREMGSYGPIFGVTGNALQSDIDYFKECGANEVLTKPLDIQLLINLMKKV
jgi:CheY-like chemotaxis protein